MRRFKSINSSSLSRKKFDDSSFTPTPVSDYEFKIWCWEQDSLNLLGLQIQKMKFSMKDIFSKCDQIRRKLHIWSHLLKISLMGKFIFCALIKSKAIFLILHFTNHPTRIFIVYICVEHKN